MNEFIRLTIIFAACFGFLYSAYWIYSELKKWRSKDER